MPKSLYQRLVEAGVEISNHHSDLHFPVNEVTKQILTEARRESAYTGRPNTFTNEINGELWYDVAFEYDPFWAARSKR